MLRISATGLADVVVMSGLVFRVYAFKLCLSLVTLKPNRFPNRAEVSRLFDRFKEPSTFLEAGRRWIRKKVPGTPLCCVTVAGSITMVEQAHRYRLGHADVDPFVDPFEQIETDHRAVNRALQIQVRDPSVPLFLSDPDGEPDPSIYLTPLRQKRTVSISSRLLMAVVAAASAAVLLTMFSSEVTRSDFVNLRASMAAVLPVPSAAARSDSSQPTQRVRQPSDAPRPPVPETATPDGGGVAMAAVAPTRDDIKSAYQSALQGAAPQAPPVTDLIPAPVIPPAPVRHLDPSEIASALSRGTALIASGDLAAARLVLRRSADAGDARSAMMLAETYDPAILEKLAVHGVVPDLAKARGWYEKAKQFGATEANQRLELLASKQY